MIPAHRRKGVLGLAVKELVMGFFVGRRELIGNSIEGHGGFIKKETIQGVPKKALLSKGDDELRVFISNMNQWEKPLVWGGVLPLCGEAKSVGKGEYTP